MRVLIINKFLYPNGGSETYIFKLGEALEQHGHEVQYFGMEHEGRCVGNRVNAYMDSSKILQMKLNALNTAKQVFSEGQYYNVAKCFLEGEGFDSQNKEEAKL